METQSDWLPLDLAPEIVSADRKPELELLLAAVRIPFQQDPQNPDQLLVPAALRQKARRQWRRYERENCGWPVILPLTLTRSAATDSALLMALLMLVCGLAQLRGGDTWLRTGSANAWLMAQGEWWRALTALTLHSNLAHWFSNLVALIFFGALLGGSVGAGSTVLLTMFAGAVGNWATAFWYFGLHGQLHNSIGMSTSVFALLGILAALAWRARLPIRGWRRWLPLMAAASLLALLGSDRATDYMAHTFGIASGVGFGMVFPQQRAATPVQIMAGTLAAALWIVSWLVA